MTAVKAKRISKIFRGARRRRIFVNDPLGNLDAA